METRKDETQEIVIFNVKMSKKQVLLLRAFFTITVVGCKYYPHITPSTAVT